MNLMDFEVYVNPARVKKGSTECQVAELTVKGNADPFGKPLSEWKAKVTPGMYKVKIITSGEADLHVSENRCTCNNRKYADYCEHTIAVMLLLRRLCQLRPVLDVTYYQITTYDKELRAELKSLLDDDLGLAPADIRRFKKICNGFFNQIPAALERKSYDEAAELAIGAYKGLHRMVEYVWPDSKDYDLVWEIITESMPWLKMVAESKLPDSIRDIFLNDIAILTIKKFVDWPKGHESPLNIMLLAANTDLRKQRIVLLLNKLIGIVMADTEESQWSYHQSELMKFKARITG